MNNEENLSQADNNNGTLGREVEAEHKNHNRIHQAPNPEGIAENERHWPHMESNSSSEEDAAKPNPTEKNSSGQISHAENNEGTSVEDL